MIDIDAPRARYTFGMEQKTDKDALPDVSYGDQDENGIDLSLLRANLRLTPTERLIRLEQAANSLATLKRNAVKRNVRLSGTA